MVPGPCRFPSDKPKPRDDGDCNSRRHALCGGMNKSESLPRLQERGMASGGASSPKYLGRMSWQKDVLEAPAPETRVEFPVVSPSKMSALHGSSSTPGLSSHVSSRSPTREAIRSSLGVVPSPEKRVIVAQKPLVGGALTYEESMEEVERMLLDHMKQVKSNKSNGGKHPSTLKHAAGKCDPSRCEFEFAPLRDAEMIVATDALRPVNATGEDADNGDDDSEGDGDNGEVNGSTSQNQKYFGAAAKEAYYKTYRELHGKTHLYVDKPKKIGQTKSLKASAALSSALELRKASVLMSIAVAARVPASGSDDTTSTPTKRRLALQPLLVSSNKESNGRGSLTVSGSSPSLNSPRVLFLSSCIAKSHPAVALVLRKENCNEFDFSHQSLGDEFMIRFASCLPDLPHVESINARDNRLGDHALKELLIALENKPNLTKLDISQNEIGRESARSLRKYISSSLCTLKTLVLNDADIDDHECTLFMIAFEQNKSVERLLMASNRIGQTRKSMALGAAASAAATLPTDMDAAGMLLPTGGEAVGSMLNVNLTIQELDLSWNMIRQNSTTPIAKSLLFNYNLRELSLAYNGCGDGGAMQLGHTLRSNATIQKLNLAYNAIGAKGGLALSSGLIMNKGLKELVLDGNPIGFDSGRELMHASCSRVHTAVVCTLSMFECNLATVKRSRAVGDDPAATRVNIYNPSDPTGKYALDLSDPYEHMIAQELLRLATFKEGYHFVKLEHSTAVNPKVTTRIDLHRQNTRKTSSSVVVSPPSTDDASTVRNSLVLLFSKIDKDSSGAIDHEELVGAMRAYGIRIDEDLLASILSEYDYDKSGALGLDEFEDFFLRCGFAMIDTDHSGALSESEVGKVLKLMGFEDITDREIKRMIAQYDLNNSGEIDEQEFIEFMKAEVLRQQLPASDQSEGSAGSTSLEDIYERNALRDSSGVIWKIPTDGILSVDFTYEVESENGTDLGSSGEDVGGARRSTNSTAIRTSKRIASTAINTLLENAQKISKNNDEQAEFLRTVLDMSDLFFTAAQAEQVLMKQGASKSWPRKLNALERILPQMVSRHEAIVLVSRLVDPPRQWQQRRELRRRIPKLYSIMCGCPTNRYRFDLCSPPDRVALKQLTTIAQTEKQFSKNRAGRFDTSQNGDWENFRNSRVNGQAWLLTSAFIMNTLLGPSNLAAIAKAMEPGPSGRNATDMVLVKRFVEFDYVSTTRPPRGSRFLTAKRFDQLLELWMKSDEFLNDDEYDYSMSDGCQVKSNAQLRWEILRNHVISRKNSRAFATAVSASFTRVKSTIDGIQKKLELLEMLVSDRWFSSEQAVAMIVVLPDAVVARARAATLLFARIVDLENFYMVLDCLSRDDQVECVRRLGWLNILDPVQPDRQYLPLDLGIRDERELVQLLSRLALTEGRECWKGATYRLSSSATTEAKRDLPLPSWGNPDATGEESLKHHGIVRLRYRSLYSSIPADHMTIRLQLRKHTLCGTRLFLQ